MSYIKTTSKALLLLLVLLAVAGAGLTGIATLSVSDEVQTEAFTFTAAPGTLSPSVVAQAGPAAQTAPPPPQQAGYPYDYPSDQGKEAESPQELPKPRNPSRLILENGRVQVLLGNERHFGYRIGDHIDVTVLIAVQKDIQLDFTALRQGQLASDGSDFELVKPAEIRSQPQGELMVYRVDLVLQTWVPKPNIVFNLDLRYAPDLAVDGKTPNWKKLSTPDFVVTRSPTADNGEELLEGDIDKMKMPRSWLTIPMLVLGIFLMLLWPGMETIKWVNRVRPRKVLPPKAAAWRVLDRVFEDVELNGSYTEEHYKQILAALRRYLDATRGVPIEPATFLEIQDRLEDSDDLELIESALTKCERVIYAGEKLSDEENKSLKREIENLVPRPWESS